MYMVEMVERSNPNAVSLLTVDGGSSSVRVFRTREYPEQMYHRFTEHYFFRVVPYNQERVSAAGKTPHFEND